MVKWPGMRGLEAVIAAQRLENDHLAAKLAAVETANVALDKVNDRLEHELDLLRTDYRNLTGRLVDMATRPVSKSLFDEDPFAEKPNKPTEFLSPETSETVDFDTLAQTLEEAGGDKASTS